MLLLLVVRMMILDGHHVNEVTKTIMTMRPMMENVMPLCVNALMFIKTLITNIDTNGDTPGLYSNVHTDSNNSVVSNFEGFVSPQSVLRIGLCMLY